MNCMQNAIVLAILAVPAGAAVKNPDTYTYLTIGDVDNLDPAWAYDTSSQHVIQNVYEHLLSFPGTGLRAEDLAPRIATRVPSRANGLISADGLTYRFPIRQGVKFHDGSALTPQDVRYSLLRFMLLDRAGGPSSLLLEPILGAVSTRRNGALSPDIAAQAFAAVTVEGGTVVVRLDRPFTPFLSVLASFGAVMSQSWCTANGQWDGRPETAARFNDPRREGTLGARMNGTGPFRLDRLDPVLKQITLKRHDAYWRGPARLKTILVKTVDEFATRKLMLEAGDADSIYERQSNFSQLQGLPEVRIIDDLHGLERMEVLFFTFKINPSANGNIGSGRLDGHGIPPDFFSDRDAREAFAASIDYEGFSRDVGRGRTSQSAGFLPPGLTGYDPARCPRHRFDLAEAKTRLQKAWGGKVWDKGFHAALVFNAGSIEAQALCQMLKKNIESLNPKFRLDVRMLQWSSYVEQSRQRKLPIFLGAWQADYPDAHNFAFPFLHSAGYFPTKQGFSDPAADRLIEEAVATLDETRRAALYGRLEDLAAEQTPFVPVFDGTRYRAQRSWVKGFVFKPTFPAMPYASDYYDLYKAE
ncbi:MAG: ABC transporter substrate-binding protein [Elusimicrobia bacterium]|nr:ABC transporter substrate-binding protein [Elusimicrobiota bacterium]